MRKAQGLSSVMEELSSDVDTAGKKKETRCHTEWTSQEEQGIFVSLEKVSLGIFDVTTLFGQIKKGPEQSLCDSCFSESP